MHRRSVGDQRHGAMMGLAPSTHRANADGWPSSPRRASLVTTRYLEDLNVALHIGTGDLPPAEREAMKRNSGARGLRSILENIMLDIMYEIPSQPDIRECVISEEVVTSREPPLLLYEGSLESA